VPNHVAFIMDGNRRFARQRKIDKIEGHTMGFDKLAECLQWCHDMEVKEVTVYAFRCLSHKTRFSQNYTYLKNLAQICVIFFINF
jgi:ditrans,polycis-polyprenyl diphosphate synthase